MHASMPAGMRVGMDARMRACMHARMQARMQALMHAYRHGRRSFPWPAVWKARRFVGWLASHPEAPEAKELGDAFVAQTAGMLGRLQRLFA